MHDNNTVNWGYTFPCFSLSRLYLLIIAATISLSSSDIAILEMKISVFKASLREVAFVSGISRNCGFEGGCDARWRASNGLLSNA